MTEKTHNHLSILALILFIFLFHSAAFAKTCYECHKNQKSEYTGKSNIHTPVKDESCDDCHYEHVEGEPKKLELIAEDTELCAECHDDIADKKHVHSAIADGSCMDCHDPHATNNSKQLIAEGNDLCAECHDDIADKKHVHSAIADGACIDCHSPHSTDNPKQLNAEGNDVCYECHDSKEEQKHVHPALTDGTCTDCHSPHSANHRNQLAGYYTTKRYVKFSTEEYELCFTCHDETLVTTEYASSETNFRNDTLNLHYVHVRGRSTSDKYGIKSSNKKGRACFGCHLSHGSNQPFMLLSKLELGKISVYSLRYTKKDNGGSCVVGCHIERAYDRGKKSDEISAP